MTEVVICSQCDRENPPEYAFCPGCGAAVAPGQATEAKEETPVALPEERKVVTTLFCDLVSFTAHSEASDHELIDALLQRYAEAARRLIAEHGGAVEKFIGDAVVAVFGFPAAHDDDAERALRCALKLIEAVGQLTWPDGDPVQVRIGVNSGEIYLHTQVDPSSGQSFLTGDAVNTAARLEAAAPPGGIVVGELTHELTRYTVSYEELEPLTVKGKREPVPAWIVRDVQETRSRTGLRTTSTADTPFLGRDAESATLLNEFETACSTGHPRFVLLSGEPGIGKSRLVLEFARRLDERPELITWRQGRCLAFGDESGFAALSDIVKAHADILTSDDSAATEAKLEAVLPDTEDQPWLRQRLRPLLGLESAPASREESFAAWTRFLHTVAGSMPTVIVFEDLHWAGEGMLAFIQHLMADDLDAPVLVLATARPELFSRRPEDFCPGTACTRLTLTPLTPGDATRLVSHLLHEPLAPEVSVPIAERVGGNPLYAEEYARLLRDRSLLVSTAQGLGLKAGEELPLPLTVHAVLTARLDTLAPGEKTLLCDAAVMGESFWVGALAQLSDRREAEVDRSLRPLIERQLLREVASSALAGETEYLFWHALTRDVAYSQLPKRVRVVKHKSALSWLEERAEGRSREFAEQLSYHALTALKLAREVGEVKVAEELRQPAIRHLVTAGDVAMGLDLTAAEDHYAHAAELAVDGDETRVDVLMKWAEALHGSLRDREAVQRLEEAVGLLRQVGDKRTLAVALTELSRKRSYIDAAGVWDAIAEAVELIRDDACQELVTVLGRASVYHSIVGGDYAEAARLADETVRLAAKLSLPTDDVAIRALAHARTKLGDRRGLDDQRLAIDMAKERGLAAEACQMQVNLAGDVGLWEGPVAMEACLEEALRYAAQTGSRSATFGARVSLCQIYFFKGEWARLSGSIEELLPILTDADDGWNLVLLHALRVLLAVVTGKDEDLNDSDGWLSGWMREGPIWDRPHCVVARAALASSRGLPDVAVDVLEQGLGVERIDPNYRRNLSDTVTTLGRAAVCVDRPDLAEVAAVQLDSVTPFDQVGRATVRALIDEAAGDLHAARAGFAAVGEKWREFRLPYEEAQALLGEGRCLVALGRAPEAAPVLAQAREIFVRLKARPALEETEALLAKLGPVTP